MTRFVHVTMLLKPSRSRTMINIMESSHSQTCNLETEFSSSLMEREEVGSSRQKC